ncbi:MAG: hypothetical protein Q3976_06445 [Corynebacterium sp.]|nr:hypothetical protein [Corynebacterium sp.]
MSINLDIANAAIQGVRDQGVYTPILTEEQQSEFAALIAAENQKHDTNVAIVEVPEPVGDCRLFAENVLHGVDQGTVLVRSAGYYCAASEDEFRVGVDAKSTDLNKMGYDTQTAALEYISFEGDDVDQSLFIYIAVVALVVIVGLAAFVKFKNWTFGQASVPVAEGSDVETRSDAP